MFSVPAFQTCVPVFNPGFLTEKIAYTEPAGSIVAALVRLECAAVSPC